MTDMKQLLEHASDVPLSVDLEGDLARGRAAARRRRVRLTGAVAGVVLVVGASAMGGYAAVTGDDRRGDSTGYAEEPNPPASTPTSPTPTVPPEPRTSIAATPIDPDTLVHTTYFDVPPPPQGWYLVGGQESYVMIARDGSNADLTGTFPGKLVVLLQLDGDELPSAAWTPFEFNGRTFYHSEGATTSIWVQRDNGDWLIVQYPRDARLEVNRMVAYADGVKVLPGAAAVS